MAKDPAILWYYNDYLTGTEELTFEQQGAYMRLLCKQADRGHLSLEFIEKILGKSFAKIWPVIKEKFKKDEDGLFYNERVDTEKNRRVNFLNRQKENGKKGGRKQTQTEPMANPRDAFGLSNYINENVNEDSLVGNEGLLGENLADGSFKFDFTLDIPEKTKEAAEQNQFTKTRKPNTDFVLSQWKVFLYERMADPPEKLKEYRQIGDLTRYFLNWIRDKHPTNGTTQKSLNSRSSKLNGGNTLIDSINEDIHFGRAAGF